MGLSYDILNCLETTMCLSTDCMPDSYKLANFNLLPCLRRGGGGTWDRCKYTKYVLNLIIALFKADQLDS